MTVIRSVPSFWPGRGNIAWTGKLPHTSPELQSFVSLRPQSPLFWQKAVRCGTSLPWRLLDHCRLPGTPLCGFPYNRNYVSRILQGAHILPFLKIVSHFKKLTPALRANRWNNQWAKFRFHIFDMQPFYSHQAILLLQVIPSCRNIIGEWVPTAWAPPKQFRGKPKRNSQKEKQERYTSY